jgi:hypothetical protein
MYRKPDVLGGSRQRDRVALRFAHLRLAVDARQTADARNDGCGLRQHVAANLRIDSANEFIGLLDHRGLIVAYRHDGRLERRDVGSCATG